ncbi:glucans biosynthesis glucosyltransferase MdoH [Caulobacter vibrioides]|uniref:Glucans biosynthesis glucosyltransferase H n=1 Tax=Caulobacter vibrioides TaxID=155892 RepID=A0A290MW89_CAUVI|nr:glucans biosynthesis glucosyltransferase MdoH [Caulobacter vibrioides]ATC31470.1 glucans biosynthesis glucosyltransferase MdoH [Caulobacter vibrioides]
MSDRSALFDVRSSTSVSLDQVVRRDTVEIPSEAPLAMPVQPLSFWQGGARRATALIQDMTVRRWMLGLMTLAMGVAGWKASFDTIALGGVTRLETVVVTLLAPLFLALSLWFCTALIGFVVLMGKPKDPLGIDGETPMPKLHTRTAILMPVYNEDAAAVFARLRAMDASIAETGAARNFDIFVISDTRDAQVALAEQACFARFRREANCNVYYRIRKENTGRKAGNVADWVSRWGSAYEHMLVLDADSLMTGEAMVRLADAMERHPGAGLIQTMPMIINGQTIFARTLQFATRLYGRVAWTGLAWWSGSESSFWGHNAIVRTRAFAETCGLPHLPGPKPFGGEVMSHDALESALLRRGGWSVHLAPYLDGSYEESPSNLLDFATRDRRWCRGNIQHVPLIALPGLHWMSRMHLVIGVLSYALSPLWFFCLSAGLISRALMPELKKAAFTMADLKAAAHALIDWSEIQATAWAMIITFVLLFGPKILGAILVLARKGEVKGFGGKRRMAAGLAVEMLFSALVAPMLMFTQTRAIVEILAGKVGGWAAQRRDADKVDFKEAWAAMGWISLSGLILAASFWFTPDLLTATAPILAGLVLAVPLTMLGAHKVAGLKLKTNGLFMTPEERRPPAIVRAAVGTACEPPIRWFARHGRPIGPTTKIRDAA